MTHNLVYKLTCELNDASYNGKLHIVKQLLKHSNIDPNEAIKISLCSYGVTEILIEDYRVNWNDWIDRPIFYRSYYLTELIKKKRRENEERINVFSLINKNKIIIPNHIIRHIYEYLLR